MADQPKKQSGGSDRRSNKGSTGATVETVTRKRTISSIELGEREAQDRDYQESVSDHQPEQSTRSRKRSKKSKKKRKDSDKKSSKGAPSKDKNSQGASNTVPKPLTGRRRSSTQSNPEYKEPKKGSPTTRFAIQPIGESRLRSKSPSRRKSVEYASKSVLDLRVRTVSGASCSSAGSTNQSFVSEESEAGSNRRLSLRSNPSCTVIPGLPYYPEPSPRNKNKGRKTPTPSPPKPESATKIAKPESTSVPNYQKAKSTKQRKPRKKSRTKSSSSLAEPESNIPVESTSTLVASTAPPGEVFGLPTSGCLLPKKRARLSVDTTPASTSVPSSTEPTKSGRKGHKPGDSKRRGKKRNKTTGSCASSGGRCSSVVVSRRNTTPSTQPSTSSGFPPPSFKYAVMSGQEPTDTNQSEATSANASATTPGATASAMPPGAMAMPPTENEPEEADMGRLQALLEARGLPSHLFGALGPRMHQLLHRSMGGGTLSKVQQLLQGLQATQDEGQQLTACIEMCQLLVMGNEDTLAGFPVKQVVPALITLLQMEHNFDMMHNSCRALTYMMEALPRSSTVVVDAVPVFLEKLQSIQCMDVAEQSLQALEMLSKRHSKNILQAGGIASCLMYLDFFSISAQRAALATTANCCQNMNSDEFHYIRDSLTMLSERLNQQDKKSVESVCLCFARLVDNFQADERILKEICAHGLLANIQQLLMMTPPVITTGTFVTVIRMLVIMCGSCPDLAVVILKQKIADTLSYLLIGSASQDCTGATVDLVSRTPQEIYEIVSLIGELLPKLPTDGVFSVDVLLRKSSSQNTDCVIWQWKDDRGMWHPYTLIDSRIVEGAYQAGEDECNLTTMGRAYSIDMNAMQQINEETGTSRAVQRKANPLAAPASVMSHSMLKSDTRADILAEDIPLASHFIKTLFGVLYNVYNSSAGHTVRHKCLQGMQRMQFYTPPELLREVMQNIAVSSHIAAMMASTDLKVVVASMQMAHILMGKLPDVFSVFFRREGVMHQIKKLSEIDPKEASPQKTPIEPPQVGAIGGITPSTSGGACRDVDMGDKIELSVTMSDSHHKPSSPTPPMRLSDVLKRKKPPKRTSVRKGSKGMDEGETSSFSAKCSPTSTGKSTPTTRAKLGKESKSHGATVKTSFLASLNPSRWGRSSSSHGDRPERPPPPKEPVIVKSLMSTSPIVNNKEKIKQWIRDQANIFLDQYFNMEKRGTNSHPALSVLNRLCQATGKLAEDSEMIALQDIACIMKDSDVSPFEIIHSGLVAKLLSYLTSNEAHLRDYRLRKFLHVFLSCPPPEVSSVGMLDLTTPPPLSHLVNKLMGCFHHLEQFQVKVHDLPGGSNVGTARGSSALRFFNTHQLKCNLQRHPDCKNLRQWKGGAVKIDPLALVQAIERYLVMRGYGKLKQDIDDDVSDDDNSDDDIDDTMAAVSISQGTQRHKLEFLLGDRVLPYNMTVYQAVKQYSSVVDGNDIDLDSEHPYGSSGIWVHTHTIWYRQARDDSIAGESSHSPKKTKSDRSGKHGHKSKKDILWTEGATPQGDSPLEPLLLAQLPHDITVIDPSLEVLALVRILHALNRYWTSLYDTSCRQCVLSSSEFVSSKLTAKANRQLQDPIVIMTGNLPSWLMELGSNCCFLLPFETRQMLFYALSFDRDRAMQRLQDTVPEATPTDSGERVAPRLDRRKKIVSRDDIIKQAEKVLDDFGNTRAVLEIQYENEVGSGLGPTLEFYALVSREMQRSDLDLWRGELTKRNDLSGKSEDTMYMFSEAGLFPAPLGRHTKASAVNKVKAKFKFLGKFMARALMDSRMLDIPQSGAFYKCLLGHHNFTSADLMDVDPVVARSFVQFEDLLRQKKQVEQDKSHTADSRSLALEHITIDGCTIEDMGLDFVLPGYPHVELKKGGKDIAVTIDNLEEYLKLVIHWTFVEGVTRQFEALREGFESVFSLSCLKYFYPEELDLLFCGNTSEQWTPKHLMECCRPDHGYTHDSKAVEYLFEILSSYTAEDQRRFLQFVTGSPRLPVGGLKSLSPQLTIVRKSFEANENPDSYLPSVMTCVNYLKLPDYSSIQVMRQKLDIAAKEGQLSFHLS